MTEAPAHTIAFTAASVAVISPDPRADRHTTILQPFTATLGDRRTAILGANGSGKTTVARLINGLTLPTTGSVRVDGHDTVKEGRAVRGKVGFLFADSDAQIIMPTPIEDIALSLRKVGEPRRTRDARAMAILDEFSLAPMAHQPVQTLSGGQRQLLALAGVLACEPEILVCDEPTTRLDLAWRESVCERLLALTQMLVIVTHDLELAARCDRGLVLKDGTLAADTSAPEAVKRYREIALRDHDARRGARNGA